MTKDTSILDHVIVKEVIPKTSELMIGMIDEIQQTYKTVRILSKDTTYPTNSVYIINPGSIRRSKLNIGLGTETYFYVMKEDLLCLLEYDNGFMSLESYNAKKLASEHGGLPRMENI